VSEWRQVSLGEITEVITKGTTPTTLGRSFVEQGVAFVKAESIDSNGRLIDSKLAAIDDETHELLARSQLQPDDILFSIAGVIGRTAILRPNDVPANTNQALAIIRVGSTPDVVAAFLYYQIRSEPFLHHSLGRVVQTAQANLSLGMLRNAPVLLPPLSEQVRISSILGSIDDLIENNRRRIVVLEEMAQAIYREWFVNFRYPGHEDATFVDSPLGPIPEGWGVRSFSEIATFLNGFAFKPSHWSDTGRPIIKIKELKGGVGRDTPRCNERELHEKYWIEPGDLLFSWSADLGVYRWSGEPGLLNQHLFVVTPVNDLSVLFLQHSLNAAMPQFWDRAQGTTMRHIKRSALEEVTAVVPSIGVVGAFSDRVEPIDEMALRLTAQTRELTLLRDLLLPKLITGEIDVSGIDLDALVGPVS
jgi:type I restriction enzyme S subunit